MSIDLFNTWGRKLSLWGVLALGLAQVGCAHSVVMEPQMVISSRIGYPPVYAQVPGPVVVMPLPPPIFLPPRVGYTPPVYAAPVYRPATVWAYGTYREERDGHHRHGHGYGHGHGDERDGWHR